jgi:hypothetical protein
MNELHESLEFPTRDPYPISMSRRQEKGPTTPYQTHPHFKLTWKHSSIILTRPLSASLSKIILWVGWYNHLYSILFFNTYTDLHDAHNNWTKNWGLEWSVRDFPV